MGGMEWTILHHELEIAFPSLVSCVQAALNTHAAGTQPEMEVLLDMQRLREVAERAGRAPDWKEIVGKATLMSPPCTGYAASMAQYVLYKPPNWLSN